MKMGDHSYPGPSVNDLPESVLDMQVNNGGKPERKSKVIRKFKRSQVDAKIMHPCEWNMCTLSVKKMEHYLFHVAGHVASALETNGNEGYMCLWRECGFVCENDQEFQRHVYFHAYHSRIKAIGTLYAENSGLKCSMDPHNRNVIPEIPEPFVCLWNECHFKFLSAQDFYWHCQAHALGTAKINELFSCLWEGCNYCGRSKYHLNYHVRAHSQEKMIACPQCGCIFSTLYQYIDHTQRNADESQKLYECSHCQSKFSTERLLKEHVRGHVNHHKCPKCEMTCTTKHTLIKHIQYRHSDRKPFVCPECAKRFTTQIDVIRHLPTHAKDSNLICYYPDCDFICKTYETYKRHIKKVHEKAIQKPYLCHICEAKFKFGARLTVHLKKHHDFQWPSGHTRFRYSKCEDGYLRLQTTRYESVELAQKMMVSSEGGTSEELDRGFSDYFEGDLSIDCDETDEGCDSPPQVEDDLDDNYEADPSSPKHHSEINNKS